LFFFSSFVTEPCSRRIKLLSGKEHGLFQETLYTFCMQVLFSTVFTGFLVFYLQNQFPNQFLICKNKTVVRFSFWKSRAVSDSGFQIGRGIARALKIGLEKAYELLNAKNHPLGKKFTQDKKTQRPTIKAKHINPRPQPKTSNPTNLHTTTPKNNRICNHSH